MADKKNVPATITENKNAFRNYELHERFEAGLVLQGTEVKSIRSGGANINDAFGILEGSEVWLLKMNIAPYSHGNINNHDPFRKRKLLLNKNEIRKLIGAIVEKGFTLVPIRMFWSKGRAKIEVALGKGKTKGDRRESSKKREAQREIGMAKRKSR